MSIENPNLDVKHPDFLKDLRLRKLASTASISIALVLIASKIIAYIMTDSVSVLSSLMDSTFDVMASALTMFSIIHAASPADEKHRFGHGKMESLAAIGQAVFILASAGYLIIESMHRFIHPRIVTEVSVGVKIMALSIILTLVLVVFQSYVIKKTKSIAISADHLHYKGDLLMNLSIIGSLFGSHYFGWLYLDPAFATIVAFILIKSSYDIAKESLGVLMDKELPEEDRERIKEIVKSHVHCCGIHDLRTRHSGHQMFIEFHLEMDQFMTIKRAHDVTEDIEASLYEAFPKAEVFIHQEPCGIPDHRLDDKVENQSE